MPIALTPAKPVTITALATRTRIATKNTVAVNQSVRSSGTASMAWAPA